MARTVASSALYMHCLPADISGVSCPAGEVEKGIFEKYRLETYRQAGFKPFVIAALIFLTRTRDAVGKMAQLIKAKRSRID